MGCGVYNASSCSVSLWRILETGHLATERGQDVVDVMERRKINIMCVQETKWNGRKARELGNGFKLFYIGENGRINGVGIILNDEIKR